MILTSDLQKWQAATNGINESGQKDLTGEEWSALVTLNESLQNGNLASNESRRALVLLKDNLNRHNNNRILQAHLRNFIVLCDRNFKTKKENNKNLILIIAALVIGCLIYSNWDTVKETIGIKMKEADNTHVDNKTIDATTDFGVVINGVKWATRNVDKPGTFAATPENVGMFYQWNRKIGWSATDPMINSNGDTTWGNSNPTSTVWETANDPSPEGWRLPTTYEFNKLLDTAKVINEWTTQNGVNGRKFTDKANENFLFLPANGFRGDLKGEVGDAGSLGAYWGANRYNFSNRYLMYEFHFTKDYAAHYSEYPNYALSLRSVANVAVVKGSIEKRNVAFIQQYE